VTAWLDTWPPAAWLAVYIASLLVLMGGQRENLGAVPMTAATQEAQAAVALRQREHPPRPLSSVG
jgi:hypothetical protein